VAKKRPGCGKADPDMELPERAPEAPGHAELEARDHPSRANHPRELPERRRRILDVAQQVGEGEPVEGAVGKRQPIGLADDELDVGAEAAASHGEHLRALVEPDDRAARPAAKLPRDGSGAGRDVEDAVAAACLDPRDEEGAPAWILAVGEERGSPFVRRSERREEDSGLLGDAQRERVYGSLALRAAGASGRGRRAVLPFARGWHAGAVSLGEELERAAAAAAAYGTVSAVLAAEPGAGSRAYLVALGEDGAREWLVLDSALVAVSERDRVREVSSIVVLCELAVELAAGGRLEELRSRLSELRASERSGRTDAAREAAAALERVVGAAPRVASPDYLDRVGEATRRLERALGEHASPLASALASHVATVEAFIAEVERRHRVPLR